MCVSSPQAAPQASASDATEFKTMITWRGVDTERLEQVRLNVQGARVKAYGRIIAAATADHDAFSASYELVTNDAGVTKRLSIHLVQAGGETQLGMARDEENTWLVQTGGETVRKDFGGAEDVDLALSPMFNALPIRRLHLTAADASDTVEVPVVYVYLPTAVVEPATLRYTPGPAGIGVSSPVATSTLTVDDNGFVIDYPGLASRV
ncbi:putative glycolipid-binding domain-containing protein [Gordonia polyisoprenivorans]|uniref:putative glycolipid-binding domain-containing protein n=1 Tax=Gordonia polyisoprenivorans TaxID=84595 RepID=UPI001AD6FCDC|nr:putative glycolipid-binding domain-containing protein [Gordonia polyisoprenivorans]QTI69286.1 putative glycolipid-binding domain-containing protein [Gordonia polyisoprenivorans]